MSNFVEQLKAERAILVPLSNARVTRESDLEKHRKACLGYIEQKLGADDRRFAEAKRRRAEAEMSAQEAIDAEKRIAEIDRIINAKEGFAGHKNEVEIAYQTYRAARSMKRKTEDLVARLDGECGQIEARIQSELDDHGKKSVQAMLADSAALPVPGCIRELKDALSAAKASLSAGKESLARTISNVRDTEAKAKGAYDAYLMKRLALAELNYLLALEQVMPEFVEYSAIKGIVRGADGGPQHLLNVDLGYEAVQAARKILVGELSDITGRDGS